MTGLGLYVGVVAGLGLASLWIPATWSAPAETWLVALVVLTLLSSALEFVVVPLPGGGSFSMATISHVATLLLVPAPLAALSIGLSVIIEQGWRRAPPLKVLFKRGGHAPDGVDRVVRCGLLRHRLGRSLA